MKRLCRAVLAAWVILGLCIPVCVMSQQSKASRVLKNGDQSCFGSGGGGNRLTTSNNSRMSFIIVNPSTTAVLLGFTSGQGVFISSATALQIEANSSYSESYPSVNIQELECQSVGLSTITVHFYESAQ